jgi:hypothetical protein
MLVSLIYSLRLFGVLDTYGTKAIVFLIAGVVLFKLLIGGENSRRNLLYVGFATIATGHRGIYVGRVTYFIALEVVLWSLCLVLILPKVLGRDRESFGMPFMLGFVCLWAAIVAVGNSFAGQAWDSILAWTAPLVVGLPAFLVVKQLITTKKHLQDVLTILMIVSLVMSVLGIVEYQFPSVETAWPWLFTGHALDTQEGFHRAAFSFFGYPAAATFIAWGMVISYDRFFDRRDRLQQVFATVVFLLGAWAVYISGQRSSWLGVGLALTVLSIPFGIRGVGAVVIVWGAITQFSRVFWNRVETVTVYLQRGIVKDTSTGQRINRASWAWDTIFEKPLAGGGYGHWLAHNAFLEIGSTIGVIPALAFMVFVVQLLFRVIGTVVRADSVEQCRYGWLFLSLTVLWILQMNVETIFQTPPFAAAHWAMMAVAWNLRDICAETSPAREPLVNGQIRTRGLIHDYSLNPNLQL